MAKRFKLRLSRVISTFYFCRSKEPSSLPVDPVPSFFRLLPVNCKLNVLGAHGIPSPPSKTKLHRSSFRRHVSSAFISVGCGCGSIRRRFNDEHLDFKWQKEDKWHVIANIDDEAPRRKIYNSASSDDVLTFPPAPLFPPPPRSSTSEKRKRRSSCRKRNSTSRVSISISSTDSGLFSSEGGYETQGEETETLVSSSRSLSADSSLEFNAQLETISEGATIARRHHRKNNKKAKRSTNVGVSKVRYMCRSSVSSSECSSPARLSMFQKLIPCTVDGKVKESFAVVKKSEDPYEDFKRSMMEMIMEKQMFEKDDLEQLLQCFLSLNSRYHHGVIVEAFSEIWSVMFCTSSTNRISRSRPTPCRITSKAL